MKQISRDQWYDVIDQLMKDGNWYVISAIIGAALNTRPNDEDFLITLLTITLPARNKVAGRRRLYKHAASIIDPAILSGLE